MASSDTRRAYRTQVFLSGSPSQKLMVMASKRIYYFVNLQARGEVN